MPANRRAFLLGATGTALSAQTPRTEKKIRVAIVGAGPPPGGPTANGWFNTAAFKIPGCPDANPICPNPVSPGRFGNAGLDILQGPSMKNADIALMKDFAIHERFKVQFQAVFANAFNHPSFARPCSFVMNSECYADISSPATVLSQKSVE